MRRSAPELIARLVPEMLSGAETDPGSAPRLFGRHATAEVRFGRELQVELELLTKPCFPVAIPREHWLSFRTCLPITDAPFAESKEMLRG